MKQLGGRKTQGHPGVWATLTIAAFPIITLSLGWMGVDPLRSFAGGAAATLFILVLEAIVRRNWWISDPTIARLLSDPELGTRLLVVIGIVILLFQTVVLTGFMMDPSFDANITRLILTRECSGSHPTFFDRLCQTAATPTVPHDADPVALAVREAAEKRFFSGGLVTCAIRPLATQWSSQSCTSGALVRCDRWVVGTITRQPISLESIERTVVAALHVMPDGTYRIDGWADDPTSSEWSAIGGDVAVQAAEQTTTASKRDEIDQNLRIETFRRVMERLQAH